MKTLRLTHLYLGLFFAPTILFFAFTGAMQTFSLHEATKSGDYHPPQWLLTMAQIHKSKMPPKIVLPSHTVAEPIAPEPPSGPAAATPASKAPKPQSATTEESSQEASASKEPRTEKSESARPQAESQPPSKAPFRPHVTQALKLFFCLVSISLFISTATGIYMAFKYRRDRRIIWALLTLGVIIPTSLTLF